MFTPFFLQDPQSVFLKAVTVQDCEGTSSAVCFQALLTRVAKTGQGALELLRCGLVAQLIECQVFDMVPDSDAHRYGREKGCAMFLLSGKCDVIDKLLLN